MNLHYIALILQVANFLAFLILIVFPFIPNGIKEKPNYYGKDCWIFYANNISKGQIVVITIGVFTLYLPQLIAIPYINIAILSLCLITSVLARIFWWRYESCIVIEANKVTVKYKSKRMEDKVFYISDYERYIEKQGSTPSKLIFSGEKEVDLGFLRRRKDIVVCKIVNRIKEEGELPDHREFLKNYYELKAQLDQVKKGANSAPKAGTDPVSTLTSAEYKEYLDLVFKDIPDEKKALIAELVKENRKIEAIKECRECTGEGLQAAKDLVEKYF